ncbi:MAG: HAD-IIB family hydrolase [Rhodobacteraceae bacterium]|nr:HAD-IIB family hydrolase [Paracoccaceae bacterium]
MKKSICLFDMDGTLTEPRKNIQQSMLDKLMELTDCVDIGIVTGSDMDYVEQQCKSMLTDNEFGSKLKIFPCNGTKYYKFNDSIQQYEISTSVNMLQKIDQVKYNRLVHFMLTAQQAIMTKFGHHLQFTGTFFQYRDSMLNWCPIGRSATDRQRQVWVACDEINKVREHWINELKDTIIRYKLDLTVALGGSTSFDIYPTGWDKTYVMNHLDDYENILFVGDKCQDGGNDKALYDLLKPAGCSYETIDPNTTIEIILKIIKGTKRK